MDQITVINLKKNDEKQLEWSWFETENEFEYHGVMYDVIKEVVNTNFITYYCIPDYKESQVSSVLDQMAQDSMAHSKQINTLKKSIEKLICICNTPLLLTTKKLIIYDKLASANAKSIPWIFLDIIVPPPKLS